VSECLPTVLLDDPGLFDPLETWEQHLAEVQQMPDFLGKDQPVHRAKMMIAPINKYSTKE
jgi:hypothetical protein